MFSSSVACFLEFVHVPAGVGQHNHQASDRAVPLERLVDHCHIQDEDEHQLNCDDWCEFCGFFETKGVGLGHLRKVEP